jgi:peptide/nickel transport system substrate-binding protein
MEREPKNVGRFGRAQITRRQLLVRAGVGGVGLSTLGHRAWAQERPLVIAWPNTPPKIDPPTINQIVEHELVANAYERLFEFRSSKRADGTFIQTLQASGEGLIEPALAESWDVSSDRRTYTIRLRKGAKSPLGNELTSEDVRWSWQRRFDLKQDFFLRIINFPSMKGFTVVDKYTFRMTTEKPNVLFFPVLALPHNGIQDSREGKKHATADDPAAGEWFKRNTAGFGPYTVSEFKPGQQVVLKANPGYWGGAPPISTVVMKEVPESANRLAILRAGDADIAENMTARERKSLAGAPGVKLVAFEPSNTSSWLALTNTIKPFDDKRVRQAVSYAVPYEELLKTVTLGTGRQQKSPLPAPYRYYTGEFWKYETNLNRAKSLLAAAGLPNGFETTLGFSNANPEDEEIATIIQSGLGKVGIRVNLAKTPFAAFTEKWLGAQYPMVTFYLGAIVPDAAYAIRLWFYYQDNVLDFMRYNGVDAKLDELLATFDEAKKKRLTEEIQKQIVDDAPTAYLIEPGVHFATRSNLSGVAYFTDGGQRFNRLRRG